MWDRLKHIIHLGVHFLDNVVEVNRYPLPEIARMTLGNRKIGLGVMGWADMLIQLQISYDTEEAIELAGNVMQFINDEAHEASRQLAVQRGPFPNFEGLFLKKRGGNDPKRHGHHHCPHRNSLHHRQCLVGR